MEALSEIGDGRLVKMEKDYTTEVDEALKAAETSKEPLEKVVEKLMILEKQTRLAADMRSNARLLKAIVEICFKGKDWDRLNDSINALAKKRGLIKSAVSQMVQECVKYVDETPSQDVKVKLIERLRDVTSGKIYVETERARLTKMLVDIREKEGKIDEACTLILDLQIETYGSMEKKEKVTFLLEQMRLCMLKKDYTRAQIIAKKVSTKFFESESVEIQNMKLTYYKHLINLDVQTPSYLDVCRHYKAIYESPVIKNDPDRVQEILKYTVLYALLAPHNNEQSDMLARIATDRALEQVPEYKALVELFQTDELVNWRSAVCAQFEKLLKQGKPSSPPTDVFATSTDGQKRWEDLKTRVAEHNLRIVSVYYTRISMKRLSEMLDWPLEQSERFLCDLVSRGTIVGAKIDRPAGVVSFRPRMDPPEALNEWSNRLNTLMSTLNKVTQMILKEEMVHRHLHQSVPTL